MPVVRPDDQTASDESENMDEDDFVGSDRHKNNIQNTYEYMNDKSFERAPEIFESDPIDSDRES